MPAMCRTWLFLLLLSPPCLALLVVQPSCFSLRGPRVPSVTKRGGFPLRMAEGTGNTTNVPRTFRLRGMRPKGVGDEIESILQGPTSEDYEEEGPEWLDPSMFEQYKGDEVSGKSESPEPRGVGGRIGLEKQVGIVEEGAFGMGSGKTLSGPDRIRAEEERLFAIGGLGQEKSFVAAIAGTLLLGVVYFSLGSGISFPQYGYNAGPSEGAVVERFEEAFVCYGIPSPDDPSGCKDSRSVGRVRVLSPQSPDSSQSDGLQAIPPSAPLAQ